MDHSRARSRFSAQALKESRGGETYIAKIPSFKITDLAKAMLSDCKLKEVGIREGENFMK